MFTLLISADTCALLGTNRISLLGLQAPSCTQLLKASTCCWSLKQQRRCTGRRLILRSSNVSSGFASKRSSTAPTIGSLRRPLYDSSQTIADEYVDEDCDGDEEGAWLREEIYTAFNHIQVFTMGEGEEGDIAGATVLWLDETDSAHSIYWPDRIWTGSYYDYFAPFPAMLPEGPVAILGFAAGTAARILLHVWPSLHLEGWEIDGEIVRVARRYFGLKSLEKTFPHVGKLGVPGDRSQNKSGEKWPSPSMKQRLSNGLSAVKEATEEGKHTPGSKGGGIGNSHKGSLKVHVGDALGQSMKIGGGFSGLIVDLFSEGFLLPALLEVDSWQTLKSKLRPGGRIIVNCGGPPCRPSELAGSDSNVLSQLESEYHQPHDSHPARDVSVEEGNLLSRSGHAGVDLSNLEIKCDASEPHLHAASARWKEEVTAVIRSLKLVFGDDVCQYQLEDNGQNVLLLTGPPPDIEIWSLCLSSCVPDEIRRSIGGWQRAEVHSLCTVSKL